jgi:hypothetical protein
MKLLKRPLRWCLLSVEGDTKRIAHNNGVVFSVQWWQCWLMEMIAQHVGFMFVDLALKGSVGREDL